MYLGIAETASQKLLRERQEKMAARVEQRKMEQAGAVRTGTETVPVATGSGTYRLQTRDVYALPPAPAPAPKPPPKPTVITVSPNIQTQVSPQISPVMQQSSGGGSQSAGTAMRSGGQEGSGGSSGADGQDIQSILAAQQKNFENQLKKREMEAAQLAAEKERLRAEEQARKDAVAEKARKEEMARQAVVADEKARRDQMAQQEQADAMKKLIAEKTRPTSSPSPATSTFIKPKTTGKTGTGTEAATTGFQEIAKKAALPLALIIPTAFILLGKQK